jgi:ribosomal-protein-alanine N-acetyltransferase
VRDQEKWEQRFPGSVEPHWRPEGPLAADVARLAFQAAPDPTSLRPLYVRPPQAVERSLEGRGPRRPLWDELEVSTPLGKRDLEGVLAIERTVFSDPWPERFFEEELEARESVACAVRHQGKLVGYVLAWERPEELHLGNLAVAAGYHRRGVGSYLVQWLLDQARKRGARCLTLEVRTSNFAAQGLYQRFGFRYLILRKGYYQDTKEDALVMIRDLVDGGWE